MLRIRPSKISIRGLDTYVNASGEVSCTCVYTCTSEDFPHYNVHCTCTYTYMKSLCVSECVCKSACVSVCMCVFARVRVFYLQPLKWSLMPTATQPLCSLRRPSQFASSITTQIAKIVDNLMSL